MNKIKELREEIGKLYNLRTPQGKQILSQRRLGILLGFSEDQIYRLESGKRQMTPHVEIALANLEKSARKGDIKIPK